MAETADYPLGVCLPVYTGQSPQATLEDGNVLGGFYGGRYSKVLSPQGPQPIHPSRMCMTGGFRTDMGKSRQVGDITGSNLGGWSSFVLLFSLAFFLLPLGASLIPIHGEYW